MIQPIHDEHNRAVRAGTPDLRDGPLQVLGCGGEARTQAADGVGSRRFQLPKQASDDYIGQDPAVPLHIAGAQPAVVASDDPITT
jgi:hypothetical protein